MTSHFFFHFRSVMLMDTLEVRPLDGEEIPRTSFGPARPVGLLRPPPHAPKLHAPSSETSHEQHSISSSDLYQISPLLSSTVLETSDLSTSIVNIPATPILQDSPQSSSFSVIIAKESPVHPSPILNTPPGSDSPITAGPIDQSSSPYPVALLTSIAANIPTDTTDDDLETTREYGDETFETDINQVVQEDKVQQDTSTRFVCSDCGKTYKLKASLARHKKTHDNPLKCSLCGEQFAHAASLKRHKENKHLGISYPCNQCPKVFSDAYTLKQHTREHNGDFRLMCDLCGKGFNNAQHFQGLVNKHTNRRPFVCTTCGRDFTFPSGFYRHTKSCGIKPSIPCPKCGKLFKTQRYLKDHMVKYDNPQQHTCHVCGLCFAHRSTLFKHMKRVHSEK